MTWMTTSSPKLELFIKTSLLAAIAAVAVALMSPGIAHGGAPADVLSAFAATPP
jgi:hypothetical protein